MVTGCAPVFMLGLLGVSLGSWFFGSHIAARLTGLFLLMAFMLYFALLNWTAQSNLRFRKNGGENPVEPPHGTGETPSGDEDPLPFTEEDRAEWVNYLRTEGQILWGGTIFLALVILILILKK